MYTLYIFLLSLYLALYQGGRICAKASRAFAKKFGLRHDTFVAKIANTRLTKKLWPFLHLPKGYQPLPPWPSKHTFGQKFHNVSVTEKIEWLWKQNFLRCLSLSIFLFRPGSDKKYEKQIKLGIIRNHLCRSCWVKPMQIVSTGWKRAVDFW